MKKDIELFLTIFSAFLMTSFSVVLADRDYDDDDDDDNNGNRNNKF